MAYINNENLVGRLLCGHKDCIHAARVGYGYVCNYILDTKKKRPCKPTPRCKVYEKGKHESKHNYTGSVPDYMGTGRDYEV